MAYEKDDRSFGGAVIFFIDSVNISNLGLSVSCLTEEAV
jgi:hypothetical protein